jgi:hypothetical protein
MVRSFLGKWHKLRPSVANGSIPIQEGNAMKPMYLPDVENHQVREPFATGFRQMRDAGVPIPQIRYLFAFKPERTDHLARFTQDVMRGPSPLPPWQRELIAAFTSKLNQCLF